MKEYLLVDTHGGHSNVHCPPDDGLTSPHMNVEAAVRKGVIPCITGHNSMRGVGIYLAAMEHFGMRKEALPGVELSFVTDTLGSTEPPPWLDTRDPNPTPRDIFMKLHSERHHGRPYIHNKGEIVCLMPSHESLIERVSDLVEIWRDRRYHETQSLTTLADFFMSNLTQGEFAPLVWNFPHPVSIDTDPLGGLMVRVIAGDVVLFSPELRDPHIIEFIDTIETYNAAHPGHVNALAGQIAQLSDFEGKGHTGGSDSHVSSWVGSGATLVEVDEQSTDGILDALRRGICVPVSGLGEASTTVEPFIRWMTTVPIKGRNLTPSFVFDWLEDQISLNGDKMARAITALHTPGFSGWIY